MTSPDSRANPEGEECASRIFAATGRRLEPSRAAALWGHIQQHQWVMSEKLGREVGFKVACLDFVEHHEELAQTEDAEQLALLEELGAHSVDRSVWNTISDTQPPKRIVQSRIILPLTELALADKHGVIPPKTIIFFGPPGTGKTHFVRAIAGVLRWWYVEISPSDLMAQGADLLGGNLKRLMERTRQLDDVVVFIDEFEELASSRERASRVDKSVTNEFLKQVPHWKRQGGRRLLVCATNYIGQLDPALLRPGRFDCVIPVGGLDDASRRTIFETYLAKTNSGQVDVDRIIAEIPSFTPADIEYLFQKVTQIAFEREYEKGEDYRLDTALFLEVLPQVPGSLSPEIIEAFERDCAQYTRY